MIGEGKTLVEIFNIFVSKAGWIYQYYVTSALGVSSNHLLQPFSIEPDLTQATDKLLIVLRRGQSTFDGNLSVK